MGFFSKDIKTLNDLFVHTLRDIYYAEKQIEKALPDHKDARTLHLKDLEGKKNVVLYFFPKALTGG